MRILFICIYVILKVSVYLELPYKSKFIIMAVITANAKYTRDAVWEQRFW